MLHLVVSTRCEEHLEILGEAYEDLTGQVFNPAGFVDELLLALTPELLEELLEDVD